MSNLPEWIQKHFRTCDCVEDPCKLDEALATAWEALQHECDSPDTCPAHKAMRRIEELGK